MPSNVQAQNIQYQRPGLSPEAKSTLMTGAMASVLGATWLAPTKIGGADNLLGLSQDKFENATKQIAALKDETEEKQALNEFKKLRESLSNKHVRQADELFGTAKEIKAEDIFKSLNSKITNPKKAEAFNRLINIKLNRINEASKLFLTENVIKNGITTETHTAIDKMFEDLAASQKYKNTLKTQFPIGSKPTPEEIRNFFNGQIKPLREQYHKLDALKRVASCAENGIITRANAEKALLRYNKDICLEEAQSCFEMMKSKLPKARFKSAAKWFGLGILISIASNLVFGMLGSFFGKKK